MSLFGSDNPAWIGGKRVAVCVECGATFKFYISSGRSGKFCSRKCAWRNPERIEKTASKKRGSVMSLEIRERLSQSRKGIPKSKSFKEHLRKLYTGRHNTWSSGEKSHWWKGGVTVQQRGMRESREYKRWRSSVLIRDARRCSECGSENKLHVHHIIPFSIVLKSNPDELFDTSNGLTLCEECHKKTATYAHKIRDDTNH